MSDLFPAEFLLLLRVLLSLVAVLALAVVLLRWLLPRWQARLTGLAKAPRRVEVLEQRPLDREHKIVLLRVDRPEGAREVLLAAGTGGCCRLDDWPAGAPEPAAAAIDVDVRTPVLHEVAS